MTGTAQSGFINTFGARVVAGVLALLIAVLWFYNYKEDFSRLMASDADNGLPSISESSAVAVNPALASCLEKRVGDVDQMKKDGILSEAKYNDFSNTWFCSGARWCGSGFAAA